MQRIFKRMGDFAYQVVTFSPRKNFFEIIVHLTIKTIILLLVAQSIYYLIWHEIQKQTGGDI